MNLFSNNSKKFLSVDWKILLPALLLSILGLITLLSTTILPEGGYGDLGIVSKQIISLGIGFLLFFLISLVDLSYLKYWQVLLVIWTGTVLLLALTLIIGPVINGVRRWLYIGSFQLQPSEIAKFAVIAITAGIFSMRGKLNELILFGITFLSVITLFLLIYLEPGGSMSLLALTIWFLMTFLALSNPLRNTIVLLIAGSVSGGFLIAAITNNWIWYLTTILGVVLTVFVLYSKTKWKPLAIGALVLGLFLGIFFTVSWDTILHDYQKERIVAFINPAETTADEGFNVNQSKIAIGSGQLFGKGFGNGTQSKRNFLPEHQLCRRIWTCRECSGIRIVWLFDSILLHDSYKCNTKSITFLNIYGSRYKASSRGIYQPWYQYGNNTCNRYTTTANECRRDNYNRIGSKHSFKTQARA
ncbi:MAG: Rod shape-determining protein RodA [candidate division WS6 bacterium GW2011_WS6_36_26]|nr:MAG: Rod shape-determining protein RodA [candidate division WS6 bacterium GW2011_WS6_36_26]